MTSSAPVAIKVSADLAEAARSEAALTDRSLTGQIEHWAKLGRALESGLAVPAVNALKSCGGNPERIEDPGLRGHVEAAFAAFQAASSADKRALIGLDRQTRFEPDPERKGGLVRITPDGQQTRGRMRGRTFVPAGS